MSKSERARKRVLIWLTAISITVGCQVLWVHAQSVIHGSGGFGSGGGAGAGMFGGGWCSMPGSGQFAFDAQSVETNRSKCGYPEYKNVDPFVIKIYANESTNTSTIFQKYDVYYEPGGSSGTGNGGSVAEGWVTNSIYTEYNVTYSHRTEKRTCVESLSFAGTIHDVNEGSNPGSGHQGTCPSSENDVHEIVTTDTAYSTEIITNENVLSYLPAITVLEHHVGSAQSGTNACIPYVYPRMWDFTSTNFSYAGDITLIGSTNPSITQTQIVNTKIPDTHTNILQDTGNTTSTLTDEYKTDELVGFTKDDLAPFPTDDVWDGAATAKFCLSDGERSCSLQKSRFRYSLLADTNQTYIPAIEFGIAYTEEYLVTNATTGAITGATRSGTTNKTYHSSSLFGNGQYLTNIITLMPKVGGSIQIIDPRGPGDTISGSWKCFEVSVKRIFNDPSWCPTCIAQNSGGGMPGGGVSAIASVDLRFDLGKAQFGQSVGRVWVEDELPSTNLCSPASLNILAVPEWIQVVSNNVTGFIEQIKAPQCLANIVVLTPSKYEINFFSTNAFNAVAGGDGHFATNGTVEFVKWTVENPDGTNAYNRLLVVEKRGSHSITNSYVYNAETDNLSLTSGNNLRRETKRSYWNEDTTVRSEVREVLNPVTSMVQYKVLRQYRNFSWGQGMTDEIVDPDGAAIHSSYTYDDHGRAQQVINGDGSWKIFLYDNLGRYEKIYSTLNSQGPTISSSCRLTEYNYTPLSGSGDDGFDRNQPRTITEKVNGNAVSRQFFVLTPSERREIQAISDSVDWTNSANLVTIKKYYTNGPYNTALQSVRNPDGTMSIFEYPQNSSGTITTNIVYSGQPNGAGTAIVDGTKTLTAVNVFGQVLSKKEIDIASGITTRDEEATVVDDFGRPTRTDYHLDGTHYDVSYSCCNLESETDRQGIVTSYSYDDLKRRTAAARNNITLMSTYDAVGNTLITSRQGTNGSTIVLQRDSFDLARRLVRSTNALGYVTTNQYGFTEEGAVVTTNLYPGGGVRIEVLHCDGSINRVTGSASHPVRYYHRWEPDGFLTTEYKLNESGGDTLEWRNSYTDFVGRQWKTSYPDAVEGNSYNNAGQLASHTNADGVIWIYSYNGKGEPEFTILDTYQDGGPHLDGTNRVSRTIYDVTTGHGTNVRRSRTFAYLTTGVNVSNLVSTTETSLDGLKSWHITPAGTNATETLYHGGGGKTVTTTFPDGSYTVSEYEDGSITSVARYNSSHQELQQASYSYDPHGRQTSMTDGTGTTTYTYNNADQVTSVATPFPGDGQSRQVTSNLFNDMGLSWKTILPDTTTVTNEYYPSGELKKTYGSRTYPVLYSYDTAGRMKTQTTWQEFANGNGAAVTTWGYSENRGFLTSKTYQDENPGPAYDYTLGGQVAMRTWARGTVTTYAHDRAGRVSSATYSDDTPSTTLTYDRGGRKSTTVQNGITTSFSYNDVGQSTGETYTDGILDNLSVTNRYDNLLRRTNNAVVRSGTNLANTVYTYDEASRLATVSDGTNSATYHYVSNSTLIAGVVYVQNGMNRLTRTNQYDNLNRLTNLVWTVGPNVVDSFRYWYNSANQRTRVDRADGTYTLYEYDALGQVISGKKHWTDGTLVAGQQNVYSFDDIGNRKATGSGGTQYGTGLRYANYTPNSLNQYTERTVPGTVDITGTATNNAIVTVNQQLTYRLGGYFWKALGIDNSSSAVYQGVTNLAILNNGTNSDIVATNIGNIFLPQTPESFSYDLDGNLTGDGRFTYTWNGENQLVQVESLSDAPTASKVKLEFRYDYMGRRIQKLVSTNDGSGYIASYTNIFVYDGWNLTGVLDGYCNRIFTFAWATDLSGSLRGAGGVGGLISMTDWRNVSRNTYLYTFDGNGNVSKLIGTDGSIVAEYEYNPFGAVTKAAASMATTNPFLFSTKYADEESDLVYYGYRYYNPTTGRWLSKDGIGERGGLNLYGFVNNQPTGLVDSYGDEVSYFPPGLSIINAPPTIGGVRAPAPGNQFIGDLKDTFTGFNSTKGEELVYGGNRGSFDEVINQLQGINGLMTQDGISGKLNSLALASIQTQGNRFFDKCACALKVNKNSPAARVGAVGGATGVVLLSLVLTDGGGGGTAAEGGGFINAFHGTTGNAGSKIATGGFRAGVDNAVFFGEDLATARFFGEEAAARSGARSVKVIKLKIPICDAERLGLLKGRPIGEFRGGVPVDVGSGYERILIGENIGELNALIKDGTVEMKVNWFSF